MMRPNVLLVFTISCLGNISSMPNRSPKTDEHAKDAKLVATSKRQQRGPYSFPITHQYLVPTSLHVIPLQPNSHLYQNQIVQQNRTVTQLVPIYSYIPLRHNYLVPVQDLQVIPLHHQSQPKFSHYGMKNRREGEEVNRFRTFYGGYGTGLYFGGHGAGHGFYVYG